MRGEMNSNRYDISFRLKISLRCSVSSLFVFTWIKLKWNSKRYGFHIGYFDRNKISFRVIKYVNTTRNEMPTHVHQNIGSFWNAAEIKLHVNRTCFHASLKSQNGMSSFRLSCERTQSVTVLFRKFVCFCKKRHHREVPRDPSTIFLATTFTRKTPESSDPMYSSFFMLENMISSLYLKWTEFTRNLEFRSNCRSAGTRTKLEQIHNFLWIWSTSGKMIISSIF